jgi:Hypothetical protein TTHB210
MSRRSVTPRAAVAAAAFSVVAGLTVIACNDLPTADRRTSSGPARTDVGQAGVYRQYGVPVQVGDGRARTYVVVDERNGGVPLEVGVALDERALDGLPAPMPMPPGGGMRHGHEYVLPMPAQNATPYRFVALNWNPGGHGYPYDTAHFDFHFNVVTKAERDAIDSLLVGAEQYLAKSANLPAAAARSPFYVPLFLPGQPIVAEARMGVHWGDARSPELQALVGNPQGYRPFTTTYFRGSWDGKFIFDEPMVTRDFILARKSATAAAQRDSVMALPTAEAYSPAGYYPGGYHVTWDERAREYRIGLTQLARRG